MSALRAQPAPQVDAAPVARVALVGLPGSGKSSVAAALADRLGWHAVDLDALVEGAAARSIADVFASEGEAGFRARELDALRRTLADPRPSVIACGGGVLVREQSRALLFDHAAVVWLDAPDGVLLQRLGAAADRPLLRDDPARRLAALRSERAAVYGRAHVRVETGDADVEEVADRVADAVSGMRLGTPAVVVDLGDRSYRVVVRSGAVADVPAVLPEQSRRVAVVVDRAVLAMGRRLVEALRRHGREATMIPLTGGEPVKTWASAGRLVRRFASLGLERGDCAVAVGGGSVGDLCGFAAAAYLRGVACVQVPTTLLAMVDSGLGGKTGVNLPAGKNLAGAFWQPTAVVCDLDALETLPDRPYRSALAEVVKYAASLDVELAALLDSRLPELLERRPDVVAEVVRRCCSLKAAVVGADERESGRRAVLNYGHTVGHALEAVSGYGDALLHGEALATGLRVAGLLSRRVLGCPDDAVRWQDGMLDRCGLPRPPRFDPREVLERTRSDKKARAGTVRWVLLRSLGDAVTGQVVEDADALAAIEAVLPS